MTAPQGKGLAFLIAFGPEVRAFLYSGLAERLSAKHRVMIIAAHPGSAAFHGLERIPLVAMPQAKETKMLERVRYWSSVLHEEWLRSRGRERWKHYLPGSVGPDGGAGKFRPIARALARLPSALRVAHRAESFYAAHAGISRDWARLFEASGIECVVTSSWAAVRTLPALQTASNLGIRTVIIANSWKDAYAKPYVPVIPDRLGVWSESVATDLQVANPHLPKERITVCGLLHLERFLNSRNIMDRLAFCARFGLEPARPIICYTAAAPAAVRNEELIVEAVLAAIESGAIPGSPQLLLRLNPMEHGTRFRALAERHDALRLQRPLWEWDQPEDWCCALPDDAAVWLATAYHAAVNVSVASTVTLEFAALGRPVINVCFDLPEAAPAGQSNRRFWDADFYREVRVAGVAAPAFSLPELIALIREALEGRLKTAAPASLFAVPSPVEAAAELIESTLAA